MNALTAPMEAAVILAGLPERISDVIQTPARERPDHPALVGTTRWWSYGELAAVVAEPAGTLRDLAVRPVTAC